MLKRGSPSAAALAAVARGRASPTASGGLFPCHHSALGGPGVPQGSRGSGLLGAAGGCRRSGAGRTVELGPGGTGRDRGGSGGTGKDRGGTGRDWGTPRGTGTPGGLSPPASCWASRLSPLQVVPSGPRCPTRPAARTPRATGTPPRKHRGSGGWRVCAAPPALQVGTTS